MHKFPAAYEAASLVQRTEGLQGRLSLFNGLSQLFELVQGHVSYLA